MSSDVEIELATHDLAAIYFSGQDRRPFEIWPSKQLTKRRDDTAATPHQNSTRVVALNRIVVVRAISASQELARR